MAVFVDDEDAFYGPAHAEVLVVILETLETGSDGGVFLGLGLLGGEGVVRKRVSNHQVFVPLSQFRLSLNTHKNTTHSVTVDVISFPRVTT